MEEIQKKHQAWLSAHAGASLGQLLAWLQEVERQLEGLDPATPIDSPEVPWAVSDWLASFALDDAPTASTVGYREAELSEDIEEVEALLLQGRE